MEVDKIIKDIPKDKIYYRNGNGVLINWDCLKVMELMDDKCVELVLTDPPYGIERFKANDGGNSKKIRSFGDKDENWNNVKPSKELFCAIFKSSDNQIIFGMNNFELPASEYFIVWDKGQKMPSFSECELAWTSICIPAKIFRIRFEMDKRHPAQKPIELFVGILNKYSKETDLVFDPFIGSGTTAVACEKLGRKWIGVEISEKYCEIAKRRIEAENNQLKLFV